VLFTRGAGRAAAERAMVRVATRYHLTWAGTLLVVFALVGWGTVEWAAYRQAKALVRDLVRDAKAVATANLPEHPALHGIWGPYRWAAQDRLAKEAVRQAAMHSEEGYRRACLLLALLDGDLDEEKMGSLCRWLLEVDDPGELSVAALLLGKAWAQSTWPTIPN
jgi:hypothetical protein